MNASPEWTVVIGNGKRMARSWRNQSVMGEMDIVDVNGREISLYAPGFNCKGEIVDDDLMRTWLPNWALTDCCYDLSLQLDIEAGCY